MLFYRRFSGFIYNTCHLLFKLSNQLPLRHHAGSQTFRCPTTNSRAATYPYTPNPQITPTALSLKKLLCRNSSLACTFEMCISTNGIAAPANASRKPTLVCVKAPGLIIMASTLPLSSSVDGVVVEELALVVDLGAKDEEMGFEAARLAWKAT